MRRGEVWWADIGGRCPVVLLSDGPDPEFLAVRIVEPAASDITGIACEIAVDDAGGLPFGGVVRVAFPRPGMNPCHWLARVAARDLLERSGMLPA